MFCFILFLKSILEPSLVPDTLTVLAIMVPFSPMLWFNVESASFQNIYLLQRCELYFSLFFFPLDIIAQKTAWEKKN